MAHGNQRGPVRSARRAARRGARALSTATLVLILSAGLARAQTPPASADDASAFAIDEWNAWVSEPGRPGFRDGAWLGLAMPPTIAGLAAGSWVTAIPDRVLPRAPWPGLVNTQSLSVATDSLQVRLLGDGAWGGFGGVLAGLSTMRDIPETWRTRSVLHFASGDFGYSDYGLAIERGDSLRLARIEMVSGERDAVGSLGRTGRHMWQARVRTQRGAHRIEGGFIHRGEALGLALSGEEQASGGDGGFMTYAYTRANWAARIGFERGYDHKDSFGGLWLDSRRDAQANRGAAELVLVTGAWSLAGRAEGGESVTRRQGEGAFDARTRWGWGVISASHALLGGGATAAVGGGHHSLTARDEVAPSLEWRGAPGPFELRFAAERMLWAAWADLAPGEEPFLQSTWAATADARWRAGRRVVHAWVVSGRSTDRAIVTRAPLDEMWLREGLRRDPDPYTFTLAGGDVRWASRRASLVLEGYGLARNESLEQPKVDPGWGGRAVGEYRLGFFEDDLGVHLRVGVEAVGARESEAIDPSTLPSYASAFAGVTATLADARLSLYVRNLENEKRPQPWIDPGTGVEAIGSGREFRFAFTLPLTN